MSSKVHGPDGGQPAHPLVWRQVRTGAPPPPQESSVDWKAQIARLEQQCEQRVREAHAAGFREGETEGRKRGAEEVQPVIERLSRAIDDVASLRPRLRKEAEADMVKLSLAIARRVLNRELAVDPDALHGLVIGALEKLQGQEVSRVRTHPSHVQSLSACLGRSATGRDIPVLADASRAPGAVLFETTRGSLDASVESQLQEIERGLADRLQRQT